MPFPHVVLNNFLPPATADVLETSFPYPTEITWKDKTHEHSKKLACQNDTLFPPAIRYILSQFNSSVFIRFLEQLTGIQNLLPDPHYEGGGMHQIEPGGYLDIHADFNRHHVFRLERRLNLLFYLNKNWPEEYGGHLELWGNDMTQCEKKILPIFNRCVIFSTSDSSFHGHPAPLACPHGMTRKSLAMYYYTNDRPINELSPAHSTLYRNGYKNVSRKNSLQYIAKRIIPPIIFDSARIIWKNIK